MTIEVVVPEGATPEQENELTLRALARAAAARGGVVPIPLGRAAVGGSYPAAPPSPSSCSTPEQFLDRMRDLKEWANLSFAELEQRAWEKEFKLPHSTIGRFLAPGNFFRMPDRDLLTAFVLACGLSEAQLHEWLRAWRFVRHSSDLVLLDTEDGKNYVVTADPVRLRFHGIGWRRKPATERTVGALSR